MSAIYMNDADGGRGGDGFGFMSFPTAGAGGGAGSVPAAFGGAQPFGAAPWNPAAPLTPTGFGGAPLGDMNAGSQFNRDGALGDDEDYANEPPLLQELGVDFSHILAKVYGVLNVTKKIDETIMTDTDMAGPLFFALILGVCLLFTGKLHFGYIYGFGMLGCIAVYLIINLMSESAVLDVARTFSILGYCLLPIVVLSGIAVVYDLRGGIGAGLGLSAVLWCTQSATRFFEGALHMREQRYLVAYPTFLLYACFALITIF